MILKQCILTANDCYKKGIQITNSQPKGIVVHSTGCNNKLIRRYVRPLKTDANYNEIITDIGKYAWDNSWNKSGISKCVHAFIGVNAAGVVETYQTLPYNLCCWGVGKGKNGSYNYNPTAYLQFEICEDNLKDEKYFNAAFKEAIEYCAYLCNMFNLTEKDICSHAEAYDAGYGTNHGDCDNWLKKFGKDMDWFRKQVKSLLNKTVDEPIVGNTVAVRKIKKGSKNQSVKLAQTLLRGLGYEDANGNYLTIDGSFGGKTQYATQVFQNKNRLTADGIIGVGTWKALLGASTTSGSSTITATMPTIKKGSKGAAVKTLQIMLSSLGYRDNKSKALSIDGSFGAKTKYAVEAYQKDNGLSIDGIVGAQTWSSLIG